MNKICVVRVIFFFFFFFGFQIVDKRPMIKNRDAGGSLVA